MSQSAIIRKTGLFLICLFSLLLNGCWTPYQLPQDIGTATFTNRLEAVKTLNRFIYTSTVDGAKAQAISTDKSVHEDRLEFFDGYALYHGYDWMHPEKVGGGTMVIYHPLITKWNYGDIREIWITEKPHMRPDKSKTEGCFVIVYISSPLWKYSVLVATDEFHAYLKAILTLFPNAKMYNYNPPFKG